MIYSNPGWNSRGDATLKVIEQGQPHDAVLAEYRLRYLPETNEIVLLKQIVDDEVEAVYSEILS